MQMNANTRAITTELKTLQPQQQFLSAPPSHGTEPKVFAEMEITAVVKELSGKTVPPQALVDASAKERNV